jgi:DNA-binding transcriptional LysR family regulator
MVMELRHLRYFVAVAEELNFTRAAARVHIAQPPLSQQIRQFEEELGVALFDRSKHHVRLTEAGEAVLAEARLTLGQANRIRMVARRTSQGLSGNLGIGFSGAAPHTVFPNIVRVFRTKFPGITLRLHELSSEQQLESLMQGSIDVGFLRLPVDSPHPSLVVKSILREPLILAVPKGHELGRWRAVPIRALAKAPFISFPRHVAPGLYDQIELLCSRAGFRPRVVQEALQIQTTISLVAAGLGVAIVPESIRSLRPQQVIYRRLGKQEMTEMGVAYERENHSPALRSLLDVAANIRASERLR